MRGGHGGSRQGVDSGVGGIPGGDDLASGSKDIDDRSEVTVARTPIAPLGSANGDGVGRAGGGIVACVLSAVTCSYDKGETMCSSGFNGTVDSIGISSSERHVDDRFFWSASARSSVRDGPFNTKN